MFKSSLECTRVSVFLSETGSSFQRLVSIDSHMYGSGLVYLHYREGGGVVVIMGRKRSGMGSF